MFFLYPVRQKLCKSVVKLWQEYGVSGNGFRESGGSNFREGVLSLIRHQQPGAKVRQRFGESSVRRGMACEISGFQRTMTFGAWVWARRERPIAEWLRG
jgi:hypothetical protein